MNDPRPALPAALLLLRAGAEPVARWLAKGITPAAVVEAPNGWALVAPAASSSLASAPYDDAGDTLLARPVPRGYRPAIGLRLVGPRLLFGVVETGLTAPVRWLAWEAGAGLVRPGGLPLASLLRLARAAGVGDRATADALGEVLRPRPGPPLAVAVEVLEVLDLPGGPALTGGYSPLDDPEARVVRPQRRFAAAFDRAVGEHHSVSTDEEDYP